MSKKSTNIQLAKQSLQIIEEGKYHNGKHEVLVGERVEKSVEGTFTVAPEDWTKLTEKLPAASNNTVVEVHHWSSNEAIFQEHSGLKTAVLNFASAKNPGGGFLGGAVAQEECLARSSSLYASLIKDRTMYEFNRSQSTFLYSDYMIYSPGVLFWMTDQGDLLEEPAVVDVITSPAPNKGAMIQNNRLHEMDEIAATFKGRIDKLFALALSQQVECLILGAWGCGVFRNDPSEVAACFKEALEGKYRGQFKRVLFAIYGKKDDRTLHAFKQVFE